MMPTPTTDRKAKRAFGITTNAQLARQRAVLSVILGAPPALVAADLGCDVATLMRWVRVQRQQLPKATRASDAADANGQPDGEADAAAAPLPLPLRCAGKRLLPVDRRVAPENTAVVDAAYRHAEFDYSGRRIRPSRLAH
ncbi:MAG TPA: hypothetical protein VMB81_26155 [Candidatus Sulfotelmatobacter sp.]|nr:hypothetical protein [Candidatus Sulfotelmatobacter sp.]